MRVGFDPLDVGAVKDILVSDLDWVGPFVALLPLITVCMRQWGDHGSGSYLGSPGLSLGLTCSLHNIEREHAS